MAVPESSRCFSKPDKPASRLGAAKAVTAALCSAVDWANIAASLGPRLLACMFSTGLLRHTSITMPTAAALSTVSGPTIPATRHRSSCPSHRRDNSAQLSGEPPQLGSTTSGTAASYSRTPPISTPTDHRTVSTPPPYGGGGSGNLGARKGIFPRGCPPTSDSDLHLRSSRPYFSQAGGI